MPASKLRSQLEEDCGLKDVCLVIPHSLLPPRFRNISNGKNMILALDTAFILQVRWEGVSLHSPYPLTPGAARRLLSEVSRNATKYKRSLSTFSKFFDTFADISIKNFREEDSYQLEPNPASKEDEGNDMSILEETEVSATLVRTEKFISPADLGGEGPMPIDALENFLYGQ